MSQDQEPITPKANHRVIDVETNSAKDRRNSKNSDEKSSSEPFQTRPSFFAQLHAKTKAFFQKLGWLFLISVVALLGYLSWSNSQNDWQIEHINTLQSQVGQLKTDLKGLKKQQIALSDLVNQKKGLTQAQQTQIESIAMFESKLNTLQKQVGELQSKALEKPLTEEGQNEPLANSEQQAADMSESKEQASGVERELTKLSLDVQDMKRQLAKLNNGQAAVIAKNTDLQNQLDMLSNKAANQPVVSLSANQIQHWAMQINTDWMLIGDEQKTLKALSVFQKAVENADLTEKATVLTKIALDKQSLESLPKTSSDSALQAITKLRGWIKGWQLKEAASNQSVSHETPIQTTQQTIWQKLEQKLMSLFSVRKRDDVGELSEVEQIAQQGVIKQRFSLLLDRLQWAIISGSQQQLESSRQAFNTLVKNQLSASKTEISALLQPITELKFVDRQPLQVIGG